MDSQYYYAHFNPHLIDLLDNEWILEDLPEEEDIDIPEHLEPQRTEGEEDFEGFKKEWAAFQEKQEEMEWRESGIVDSELP